MGLPIAVINESTVLTDAQVQAALPALQHQVTYHFAPHWNQYGNLHFFSKGAVLPSTYAQMAILDNSDQAGALGYHDKTAAGLPVGKVFAATDAKYGLSWTVTLSHELLEMLADPRIQRGEQVASGEFYALEVGDPVESDSDGYLVSVTGYAPVRVSNFILEAWFDDSGSVPGPYDYRRQLTAPLQVRPGGYVSIWDGTTWTQKQMRAGELVVTATAATRVELPEHLR